MIWENIRYPLPHASSYINNDISYSPWNVLLSHLNGERTVSERWVNGERTLNERWANAEWTMSERWTQVGERYVNAERWANAERERSANASAMWTVNARWAIDERFIRKVSGIFLALYLTPNLVRIYTFELLNLVILFEIYIYVFVQQDNLIEIRC